MIRFPGPPGSVCDGRISRRETLRVGGLSALGLQLPDLLAGRAAAAISGEERGGRARSCILVFLFGGPSHIDTWDPKPDAPAEIRGEFQPLRTRVPGMLLTEHFPLLARQAGKFALLRSLHQPEPRHGFGLYYMLTGRAHPRPDIDAPPRPEDFPFFGSLLARFRPGRTALPPVITLPRYARFDDLPSRYAGQNAGFLPPAYHPWLIDSDPNSPDFHLPDILLPAGLPPGRLAQRRLLLQAVDRRLAGAAESGEMAARDAYYRRAWQLLGAPEARRAFDLTREPDSVRDRYGRHPMGQGLLLARRLVEAGVSLVTVNWHRDGSDVKSPFWDTHKHNFSSLKERLIPPLDRGLSALLEDLHQRGLLESTLVLCFGEFGRTPKVGQVVQNGATTSDGRDHWSQAYTALLAGGGIRGGRVYGASDEHGAYAAEDPVGPPDFVATVLHCLGVDPHQEIRDPLGQVYRLSEGNPIHGLL